MQRNKLRETRTSVWVRFITLITLMVVATVWTACRSDTNKNGQTVIEQTPSPSPSPSASPKPYLVPGDTIIVIKGGSVRLAVNKTICADDDDSTQPDDKKYKCESNLGELGIQTSSGPACLPLTPNSTIIIDGGGSKPIEIKETGNKVMIKFKKAHYPQCPFLPAGEHCNLLAEVGTITVANPTFTKSCSSADACEFWVRKK